MQPFDIYNAVFEWQGCQDMRPWLVVDIRPEGVVGCLPIASQAYGGSSFFLDSADRDFPATGLKKSCHIHDSHIYDIPAANFRKRRGALTGELLQAFREYAGV